MIKRNPAIALAMALALGASQALAFEVQVKPVANGSLEVALRASSTEDLVAGLPALSSRTADVCKDKPARYGASRYSVEGASVVAVQELSCGPTAQSAPSEVQPGPSIWRPTEADKSAAERAVMDYFRARDAGDLKTAFLMRRPGTLDWDRWREGAADFNKSAGAVRSRKIRKLSWYVEPQSGGTGVFAGVDFESDFENLAFHCGFMALMQQPSGKTYVVGRERESGIELDMVEKMKPDELEALRKKLGC